MWNGLLLKSLKNTMQTKTSPTPEEISRISELITSAHTVGGKAVEFSAERLNVCLAIGEQFLKWKGQLAHGKFEAFATEHFPQLPASTRGRWQQLAAAKLAGRLDVSTARGLRHAYQLAGIIPDNDPIDKDKGGCEGPDSYLIHIARAAAALGRVALDDLERGQRELLKERLRPIVTLFYQINTDTV